MPPKNVHGKPDAAARCLKQAAKHGAPFAALAQSKKRLIVCLAVFGEPKADARRKSRKCGKYKGQPAGGNGGKLVSLYGERVSHPAPGPPLPGSAPAVEEEEEEEEEEVEEEEDAVWTCEPAYYDTNDGCDCSCGIPDPDCEKQWNDGSGFKRIGSSSEAVFGCPQGSICTKAGKCVAPPTPAYCAKGKSGKAAGPEGFGGRVVNGGDADQCIASFAWLGNCGGTAIAPNLVLTAGHCVDQAVQTIIDKPVFVGINEWDGPGKSSCCAGGYATTYIKEIHVHPDYLCIDDDLAILVVDPPIPDRFVACPAPATLESGTEVLALGLGATDSSGANLPGHLQVAAHEIYDGKVCEYFKWFEGSCPASEAADGGYAAKFYCSAGGWHGDPGIADPASYSYICFGDSGSGLLHWTGGEWTVAGVVSWGYGDPNSDRGCGMFPESFVNLAHPNAKAFVNKFLKKSANNECAGWA